MLPLFYFSPPPPLTNARKENAHHKICRKKCEKFAHTNRHTHYVFFSTIHLQIIIFYLQTIFPTDLTSVSGLLFERFMGRRLVICGEAWIVSIPFSITHRHLQCMWPDFANIYWLCGHWFNIVLYEVYYTKSSSSSSIVCDTYERKIEMPVVSMKCEYYICVYIDWSTGVKSGKAKCDLMCAGHRFDLNYCTAFNEIKSNWKKAAVVAQDAQNVATIVCTTLQKKKAPYTRT